MKILCIDSERTFVQSLKNAGYTVRSEELGYRSGSAYITTPPQEVDAMFFNLERPACFDKLKWGTLNTTFKVHIESSPTDTLFKRGDQMIPRYQLITYNQINTVQSPFVKNDIVNAIKVNGRPLFIFMNVAYMKHIYYAPNFLDIKLNYVRTEANTFKVYSAFSSLLPSLFTGELSATLPIMFKIELDYGFEYPKYIDITFNERGEIFSKLFLHGKGLVWFLPEFKKNDAAALYILQNLKKLKNFVFEMTT
ncbi:hypothetical protein AMJ52_04260 [candidate division TA06 bacterium DG_78]|uniref:Uncharacterized protein n=1 Tax=candidate division TA06 bacterium DG_78 TaxID=1703772 RepID=A0A0S7YGF8_UNCT6|nr:MAG: hypothetical protein AMJ52_04260 [candidate division TA06 bacterium DG_78]